MILLIMSIIAGCLVVSYSRANNDTLIQEPFTIKTTAPGEVLWALNQSYKHTQLQYKGSKVEAYYSDTENLIGFGKTLAAIDLPATIIKKIRRRFNECNITSVMLFINTKGNIYYYAGVMQGKALMAVKISSKCRLNVLQKLSLN
ncbi:hypothetical protein FRZ67_04460 [Panacibacter ginsenosidivorans]|uniref:DUF4252 domain-containing protein n=1 Tax=Panacibacter ginsenosidivorans TaxID=1813871 RepID=A0A5B8V5C5_9BACT|nr:hypothetical protein [Panacibacter ginsenosidivorans]QEC66584.1 hypothetical protein FRZ67_04460 [Panacibacter ginsenosidivorans]